MQTFIHSGGLNAGFWETRLHVYACMQSFMHRAGGGGCLGMWRRSPFFTFTCRSLNFTCRSLNARSRSLDPVPHAERSLPPARSRRRSLNLATSR